MNTAINHPANDKLKLDFVLQGLQKDGLISAQQVAQLESRISRDAENDEHPLITISDQGWQSASKPPFPLTLERITRWIAEKSAQEYFRIDPLKVDVSKITSVVSQAMPISLRYCPLR